MYQAVCVGNESLATRALREQVIHDVLLRVRAELDLAATALRNVHIKQHEAPDEVDARRLLDT